MRVHVELQDELVERIDDAAGHRGRSGFIREAVESELERRTRRKLIQSARGTLAEHSHDWDDDTAQWVRVQRRSDPRRTG